MAKPAELPRWCNNPTTLRTVPPEGLKDVGAPVKAKWPSQYLNWLHGLTSDWIAWLNGRLFDEYTLPTAGYDCRFYGTNAHAEVKNSSGTLMPIQVADPTDDDEAMTSGHMLYDLDGKLDRCAVTKAGQDLGKNTETKILWDTILFNVNGPFAGSGNFVAKTSGYYHMALAGKFTCVAACVWYGYIRRYSSSNVLLEEIPAEDAIDAAGFGGMMALSRDIYLDATDYVVVVGKTSAINNKGYFLTGNFSMSLYAGYSP